MSSPDAVPARASMVHEVMSGPVQKGTPRAAAGAIRGSSLSGVALGLRRSGNPQTLFELNPHRRGKTAEMLNREFIRPTCLKGALTESAAIPAWCQGAIEARRTPSTRSYQAPEEDRAHPKAHRGDDPTDDRFGQGARQGGPSIAASSRSQHHDSS